MSIVTEITREVALLVEREPRSVWAFTGREVAQLNDLVTVTPFAAERDVAQLNDSTTSKVLCRLREVALLNDSLQVSSRRTRIVSETALLKSRAVKGVRHTAALSEVAQLNDAASSSTIAIVREAGQITSRSYSRAITARVLREVFQAKSRALNPSAVVARDTALLSSTLTGRYVARKTERDTALISSAYVTNARRGNVLREIAGLNDSVVVTVQGGGTLREVAYLYDKATPPVYGRAYTCSIVTWGMSTLSNYAFLTMAGKYAAGANLWRLDADDDYGTPITSLIKTGVLDLGASQTKRLSSVYAAGTADAPLTVSVTADVNGQKESHAYTLQLRDQDDYRNNRTFVGKGFRGRFIQFTIGGTAVKYRLVSAEADVVATTRRV